MNNAAPENTAALQEKIAELEQQLKLSDEGASHLAERCLSLEQKVQSYLAAHPQREMHTDSPTLLQPLLYYDAGFGFSEKDTLTAPDCTTDELTGAVTATFELPVAVQALRFALLHHQPDLFRRPHHLRAHQRPEPFRWQHPVPGR